MMHPCPYCGRQVRREKQTILRNCPRCRGLFRLPAMAAPARQPQPKPSSGTPDVQHWVYGMIALLTINANIL